MGTRNRERRKAKQKAREHHRRQRANVGQQREPGRFVADLTSSEVAEALVVDAVGALHHGDAEDFERSLKLLVEGPGDAEGHRVVDRAVLGCLQRDIGLAWRRGWQPADVARLVGRQFASGHVRLAVDMIAAQMRGYALATVDQRWLAQLTALGASVWWDQDSNYFERLFAHEGLDRGALLRRALEVLSVIDGLPNLPHLCPLPGTARPGTQPRRSESPVADGRMLDKVRALLAKAESTEFPKEAEAFTAKAQELMARHSIDHAMLTADTGARETPGGVRVGIDNPYEAAKALLLQNVAEANRCRTVWSRQLGFATLLGYPGDVDAVEVLYTSLLVQATAAVVAAGSRRDSHGRSRTRSFRSSFLNAYAIRIGQRLRAATDEARRAATATDGGDRLLPVLAARDDAVRETVETMFPEFVSHQVRISDREGWASGTATADLASLNKRREVDDRG